MKNKIEAIGEAEETVIEKKPQIEHLQWVKGEGDFSETIEIQGTVPKNGFFHVKAVIQIRDATDAEIARHVKDQESSD